MDIRIYSFRGVVIASGGQDYVQFSDIVILRSGHRYQLHMCNIVILNSRHHYESFKTVLIDIIVG